MLIALLSQFNSILENEAEKKLGVTLDEVLEIHRDSYLSRLCDMTFLKMSELHQNIAELGYFLSSSPDKKRSHFCINKYSP